MLSGAAKVIGARLRRSIARIGLAALMGGAPALAGAADMSPILGRWDSASTDCSFPRGDGVFVVEQSVIRFFEAICDIDQVRAAGVGKGLTARMSCEGEGEPWTDTLFLAPTEENTLMVYYGSGYGYVAGRCAQ